MTEDEKVRRGVYERCERNPSGTAGSVLEIRDRGSSGRRPASASPFYLVAALVMGAVEAERPELRLLMKSPGGRGRPAVGSGPWGASAGTVSIAGLRDFVYPDTHLMLAPAHTDDIAAQLAELRDRRVYVEGLAVS